MQTHKNIKTNVNELKQNSMNFIIDVNLNKRYLKVNHNVKYVNKDIFIYIETRMFINMTSKINTVTILGALSRGSHAYFTSDVSGSNI